jgi:hypothetical protein
MWYDFFLYSTVTGPRPMPEADLAIMRRHAAIDPK